MACGAPCRWNDLLCFLVRAIMWTACLMLPRTATPVIVCSAIRTLASRSRRSDKASILALTERFEKEKRFEEIVPEKFFPIDGASVHTIQRVVQIYEQMKYSLEDVPTTLSQDDVGQMSALPSSSEIRRYLRKLHRRELNHWIREQLQQGRSPEEKAPSDYSRSGIFDREGNLVYGLWHNSLFTRVDDKLRRLVLDRHRLAYYFGQNLLVDFSHSHHLSYHLSAQVAADLASAIFFNFRHLANPYRITLTGIDYNHHLWKFLLSNFPHIPTQICHTEKSFLELFPEPEQRENVTYFTSIERNPQPLEYFPDRHYVVAALSEPNIHQNFLIPSLRNSGIETAGVPFDRHVLWNRGTKRLSIKTKVKILDQIRLPDVSWKQIIRNNIRPEKLKC